MLNALIFFLLFASLGALSVFYLSSGLYENRSIKEATPIMLAVRRLCFALFIAFTIPYLIYLYQAVKYVMENGYLAVYLNESATSVTNPFLRISDDFCIAGCFYI